jgi:hypothetical protein
MNVNEIITKNKLLEEELQKTKDELILTQEHLKKYTNNTKRYYEKNKEEIIQKVKDYREITNYIVPPEVIKKRNKKAYLKRKEKLKELDKQNGII